MIREAVIADLSALLEIQNNNGYNNWSQQQLKQALENGCCLVLEQHNNVVGFALFSLVLDEAELLNVVLLESCQGKGGATSLLVKALSDFRSNGVKQCFLEVGVDNQKAICLYNKLGFKPTGKRKNYYKTANGKEDALLMQFQLQE